jgi:hypothetical protein
MYQQHAAGLAHNGRNPIYKEKYNAADMKPDVQVPLTSATQNFPVEETPVI